VLDNGAQSHKIIRVPVDNLAAWDATHDVVGRALREYERESKDSSPSRDKGGEEVGVILQRAV
jgi:hypothetical protein